MSKASKVRRIDYYSECIFGEFDSWLFCYGPWPPPAGIMLRRANIMEQARISTLVACVPKVPLAIFVFMTLLYAIFGILVVFMAETGETKNV